MTSRAHPWRGNPLLRVFVGLLVTLVFGEGAVLAAEAVFGSGPVVTPVAVLLGVVVAYASYLVVLVRLMEGRRAAAELDLRGAPGEWLVGIGLGGGLLLVAVGTIAALGGAHLAPGGTAGDAAMTAFAMAVLPGFVEELAFRGVLLRIVERSLGTWHALALSSLCFGFVHMLNDHATLWSSLAITMEAGVLLGAVYLLTRRLWACVGIHLGWNLAQGWLGLSVSGNVPPSGLCSVRLDGPELLTGGAFGPEASAVTVAMATAAGGWTLWRAHRAGSWVDYRL
ncbi:MAG: CPBP family intramembrane metalloprotease [Dactylosporangium sp.]|nr:CPBP family intramembrane metalloprotease [Dactylosporangium sp.]NNJ60880.1 CPBP family intramembrane metalloprotease [Dactylosporangium sp.]